MWNNGALLRFHEMMKNVVDPNGVLAPGRAGDLEGKVVYGEDKEKQHAGVEIKAVKGCEIWQFDLGILKFLEIILNFMVWTMNIKSSKSLHISRISIH